MTKEYANLGIIQFKPNKLARRITVRYREAVFIITYPSSMKIDDVEKSLETMRPRLLLLKERSPKTQPFSPEWTLETYSFNAKIIETGQQFYLTLKNNVLYIVVPTGTDFEDEKLQSRIHSSIESILRSEAKRILPAWVKKLAEKNRFNVKNVKINKSQSRWGSCSARKDINLSYFCLLLPEHLIELIILHELCHTVEMNHSDRFWQLLSQVTDNNAPALTKELKTTELASNPSKQNQN